MRNGGCGLKTEAPSFCIRLGPSPPEAASRPAKSRDLLFFQLAAGGGQANEESSPPPGWLRAAGSASRPTPEELRRSAP